MPWSTLTLYIDGLQVASAATAAALNLVNSSAVTLGTDPFSNRLSANLADVLVTRIMPLRARMSHNLFYAPIANWNFNEGTGTTAFDDMMNENDMTMPGSSPPTSYWYPLAGVRRNIRLSPDRYGSFGGGLTFRNDPIAHASALGDFNTGDFTASCWVKPVSTWRLART